MRTKIRQNFAWIEHPTSPLWWQITHISSARRAESGRIHDSATAARRAARPARDSSHNDRQFVKRRIIVESVMTRNEPGTPAGSDASGRDWPAKPRSTDS
jgi:hypothetical protein